MSESKSQSILASAVAAAEPPIVRTAITKRYLRLDESGFLELIKLHHLLDAHNGRDIQIDVSKVHSFDTALAAPLMVILRRAVLKANRLFMSNAGPLLRHQFQLHQIIGKPTGPAARLQKKPSRPPLVYFGLSEFAATDSNDFANYSKRALDRSEMPVMTESLKEKFFEGIDELFENSALHSQSPIKNVSCGVYNRNSNSIKFVFADGGRGMRGAYEAAYSRPIDADKAIDWAMTTGNTTRQGGISGGLGLKIIREFIRLNGGRLTIVSREGFWTEKIGICKRLKFANHFPGTVVTIEVNTLDRKSYDLVKPDPKNIW